MHQNKLILLLLFLSSTLLGQQVEQYSLGHLYQGLNNPGAIGTTESLQAVGIVRQQWVALSGAPTNQYLSVEMPLGILSGGIGASFKQTQIGAHKIQKVSLGYSYHKVIGDNAYIGIGLKGGMLRTEYDGSKLRTPDGEYNGSGNTHHDDILNYATQAGNTYRLDAGIYSKIGNLSVGFSVLSALAGKTKLETFENQEKQHYLGSVGYVFEVGQSIQVNTGVNMLMNSGVNQMQGVFMGTWNELYSLGVSMRGFGKTSMESIGGIAGYKLNEHFQLFYTYEYNILPVKNVFDANHELALAYSLNKQIGKGKLPKSIYNPRYF